MASKIFHPHYFICRRAKARKAPRRRRRRATTKTSERARERARGRRRWGAMATSCPRGRKCWGLAGTSAAAARTWPRTTPWWKLACRWALGTPALSCLSRWTSAASTPSTCPGSARTRDTATRSASMRSSCNACARCRRLASRSTSSPSPSLLRSSSSSSSARVTCLFLRTWFLFSCRCGGELVDPGYCLCMLAGRLAGWLIRVSRGEVRLGRMHEYLFGTIFDISFHTSLAQFLFEAILVTWFLVSWRCGCELPLRAPGMSDSPCTRARSLGFSGWVQCGENAWILHGTMVDISFQHRSCSIPYFCQSLPFDVFSAANVVVNCLFICLRDLDSSRNGRSWQWPMFARSLIRVSDYERVYEYVTALFLLFHFSNSLIHFPISVNPCLLDFLSAAIMVVNCPFVRGLWQLQKRPIMTSGLCMIARWLGFPGVSLIG